MAKRKTKTTVSNTPKPPPIEARSVTVTDAWGHTKVVGGFGDVGGSGALREDKATTIEFDDDGPDKEDKRRFTLTWPVEPRLEGFKENPVLVTRRGQCFKSAQWREFIAKGAEDITK